MTPALAAAFRLACTLPVRTHMRAEPADKRKLSMTGSAVEARRKQILTLHRQGWNAARIGRHLGISANAVRKTQTRMGLA